MGAFILRKAGAALIVVFLASVLVFVGVRAIPGDPALAYAVLAARDALAGLSAAELHDLPLIAATSAGAAENVEQPVHAAAT